MSEAKALITVFAALMVALVATLSGLLAIDANEGVLVLDFIAFLVAGSFAVSSVVVRYDSQKRRR